MNINPENALSVQHKDWLTHPVTRQMLSILEKQKTFVINRMCGDAGTTSDDGHIHRCAMTIKALDSVRQWITNTEKFVEQTNK